MDSSIPNENILEQALRTYEESERSLKSICYSVEQENLQLENQLKQFQIHHNNLIQQSKQMKQQIRSIQKEFQLLNQKQILFHQQTDSFHQRYEQLQLALKKVLSSSISSNDHFQEQTFPLLNFTLIPIQNQLSDQLNNKRKSINSHSIDKHQKTNS